MRPTENEIGNAIESFEALKFFPLGSVGAKREIMRQLGTMVGTSQQLKWLVRTMIEHVGTWDGPAQLRAVFCTRFKPADGIEAKEDCRAIGFTPDDCEAEHQRKYITPAANTLLLDGVTGKPINPNEEYEKQQQLLEQRRAYKARLQAVESLRHGVPEWLSNLT